MDTKATSAIIAAGIWLSVVMVFCTLYLREAIRDAAPPEPPDYLRQLADIQKSTACIAWHAEFEAAAQMHHLEGIGPNPC